MRVTEGKPASTRQTGKKAENPELAILATCPTGQGGWCSYPFSPKQLQKRLKAKAKLAQIEHMQKQTARGRTDQDK